MIESDKQLVSNTEKIRWCFESGAIKTAKRSYYDNKVDGLAETNPKKWWWQDTQIYGGPQLSRQNLFTYGKINFATAKSISPRQSQFHHGKINFTIRQNQFHHGKIIFIHGKINFTTAKIIFIHGKINFTTAKIIFIHGKIHFTAAK